MSSEANSDLVASNLSNVSCDSQQEPQDSFAIAAIGASAGGLEVFTQLLTNLPPDTDMGFVLIQHLAPQHDSELSEILQNATVMPVNEATDGMKIVPNSVYVIPPNTVMTLDQGILRLSPRRQIKGKHMVIDSFFSSLAADIGDRAIAIVLSGNNEDGTAGLGVIKSVGGVTFAQDLVSAEYPTMPMIAIASGYVDYVLSPTEIASELVSISLTRSQTNDAINAEIDLDEAANGSESLFTQNIDTMPIILGLLYKATGVDFNHYKQGTIRRRILRRMGLLHLQSLEDYAQHLQEHPNAVHKLYNDILINVTSFFRDPESFVALKQLVFPAICDGKSPNSPIRIWVAGCSTGEEVYSIAICLLEFFDETLAKYPIQIFATDISETSINKARSGIYSNNLVSGVSSERLRRFFTPNDDGYQIGKAVREICVFARQNLTSDPPFSRLDLISCRNMLIYLEPLLQKKVMPIFHYALNPNSFLMLGSAEGIGNAVDLFEIANKKQRIYKRKLTPHRMNFNFVKSTYVKEMPRQIKQNEPNFDENLEQLADQLVLNRYARVGAIVNVDLEILQFRGQTSQYLTLPSGKASLNLIKMARPELVVELRTAIHEAQKQDIPICKEDIEIQKGVLVKIDVVPIKSDGNLYFLVLFESRQQPNLTKAIDANLSTKPRKLRQTEAEMQVVSLTHELEKTKQYLRSIIEAQEATNQELKIAGEEFLSSNEELQSANEELETAKEEIQATNEELNTINDELRSRNYQLTSISNDIQNLLSSANIPILMVSGDFRIRRFTPMAEQIFNLISSDIGRPFSDIQSNIDVPNLRELVTSVIDTLIPYEKDIQDLSGHWYILRIRPYRTSDNKIDGAVISLFDIDLLKRNTIELGFSRNYSDAIIQTLRQPLLVLDANLHVITANFAFYKIFQINPLQTEHQSVFDLGMGDWNIPKLRSLLNDILNLDISVQDYEVTQNFDHLGIRTMLINACQVENTNVGKMILIAIEDITERHQQKQLLLYQNRALTASMMASENANRAKTDFLRNMSHELRTPLNAIMGFAQIFQLDSDLSSEYLEYASIIFQSGEHLLSLIKDLLDISRLEADKMQIQPNLLVLIDFLERTVEMVNIKATQKNITFTKQFAIDLPTTIYADENRLRQILLNLLSNAIKFTDTGGVTFAVNKVMSTDDSGKSIELIQFAIADTGVGIATTELTKIFLPFEQVGDDGMKPQGTGLGLAISQGLANMMGGKITATSTIGVGSSFSFELNLMAYQATSELETLSAETNILLDQSPITSNLSLASSLPLKILIAEDIEFNQVLLQRFLQRLGYEPILANNGLEVLSRLRENQYDLVLLDIQMPEMNGIEVTKRIVAEWNKNTRPYIIAVTANSSKEDQQKCIDAGINAFIAKPIDFNQLEKLICQIQPK